MERKEILYYVDLYFSEVLEDGKLKEGITEDMLKSFYYENKAIIGNTRFNGNYKARLNNLGIAYSYLLNMVRNPHALLDRAFSSYYELVKSISEYGFVERDSRTTGQSQNEAQENMMTLLGNFDQMLAWARDILRNNEEYVQAHKNDLLEVIDMVEEQTAIIRSSAALYHDSLTALKNNETNASEVGRLKKQWRLDKNEGLQKALDFIREIRSLTEGLVRQENTEKGIRIKDYSGIPVNVFFINNIKKIKKSGVYYSFLSEREKEDIEKGITR
jgi:hypothetical protein